MSSMQQDFKKFFDIFLLLDPFEILLHYPNIASSSLA